MPSWVPRCGGSSSRPTSRGGCDADPGVPLVYVSFGSFLSVRADVLARVAAALRTLPVRVALAIGSADRGVLGELPALAGAGVPAAGRAARTGRADGHPRRQQQRHRIADLGVPMLVLPFSTDQFAGAAAIEQAGVGEVLDPNGRRSASSDRPEATC